MIIALRRWLTKTCRFSEIESSSRDISIAVGLVRSLKPPQKNSTMRLETPKGTRDFDTRQTVIRQRIIEQIVAVFRKHGAENIETPDFELKEILAGKYGEYSKQVYNLIDQGGELLALRYDLTLPFARYLAMNKISNMKRFQTEKVYRRDEPSLASGRLRELYQCDFDIAGLYDPMLPDAECIRIVYEVFETLRLGDYSIRINHRRLLEGIFEYCGVRASDFKSVCASIGKLDKEDWKGVRDELVNARRLSEEIVNKVGEFVQKKGPFCDIFEMLERNSELMSIKAVKDGLHEMKLLFDYVQVQEVDSKVLVFDLSLTRAALDYYTALVFDVVLGEDECGKQIGAVAAGGRYDNLVSSLDLSKRPTPCVGLSIAVEKIFVAVETYGRGSVPKNGTDVYVISAGRGLVEERLKLCSLLWDGNIKVEHSNESDPELTSQLNYCETRRIPFAIVVEAENVFKLRDNSNRTEIGISRSDLVERLQSRLKNRNDCC